MHTKIFLKILEENHLHLKKSVLVISHRNTVS